MANSVANTVVGMLEDNREYGMETIRLKFVNRTADGKIRNLSGEPESGLYFDGLTATTYVDRKAGEEAHVYGNTLGFRDVYNVELPKAEAMVKTLKTINRKMDKFNDDFGYASDFGQWAIRLLKAVGVTEFITTKPGKDSAWDSTIIHTHKAVDVAWQVQQMVNSDR